MTPFAGDTVMWLDRFRKYQDLEVAAKRRRDIATANRHVEKVTEALDALVSAGVEGRGVLEQLMSDPDPSTRGRAARRVIAWDADHAVPVLARLLYEPLDPESIAFEAVLIQMEARYALLEYFGLDMYDPTELPSRLAAMGIVLPDKIARRLRRED